MIDILKAVRCYGYAVGKRDIQNRVEKPWGYEEWIVNHDLFCGKILFLKKGFNLSWHYHKLKNETFYILEGKGKAVYQQFDKADETIRENKFGPELKFSELNPGDCFDVPVYTLHQIKALEDLTIIEFSTTHYDSDSHRITREEIV